LDLGFWICSRILLANPKSKIQNLKSSCLSRNTSPLAAVMLFFSSGR
jgi:hypothetical protein